MNARLCFASSGDSWVNLSFGSVTFTWRNDMADHKHRSDRRRSSNGHRDSRGDSFEQAPSALRQPCKSLGKGYVTYGEAKAFAESQRDCRDTRTLISYLVHATSREHMARNVAALHETVPSLFT